MARRRKSVWPYLILTLAVVGAGIAWRGSDLGSAAADLERQRAAARREGVPMEWNDVRRLSPPVPDEINAAALYVPAFEGLANDRKVANQETLRALFKGTAKPEQIEEARRELAKVVSRLEDVKAASRRKAFSMDRQWERGWELLFPEYAQARTASRALIMRALLSKDPASATDDLRAVARMRAHFGSEPVLIAALVGNSIESDVHSAVRTLGRRGGAWPTALGPVLGDLGPIPSLKRTLTSEAVSGMRFDEQLAKTDMKALGYPTESSMPLALRFMKVPAVRDASMTRVTEFWRKAWKGLPEDPADFRAAQAALKMPEATGPSYAILDILMPVFDQFAQTNTISEANRRLTRDALALWSGRKLPIEKDPFGTGPLRLKREANGWTLYSVGPDGADNGARPREESGGKPYDLVVRS